MAETKAPYMEGHKINVKRRGNALGIWLFESILRVFGLKGAYLLLEVVSIYYLLFDSDMVNTSLAYIEKRFPGSPGLKNYWHVHRHIANQGRQVIDRYAIACHPDYFTYHEINTEKILQVLQESKKGVVLLTSHAGNWQVALRQIGRLKKDVCIVARTEDNPAIKASVLIGGQEAKPVETIDPESYLGGVIEMMQTLRKGKLLCIMGDRSYGFDTLQVSFLGAPAYFPYGAFYVAAATGSPVVALLTHKTTQKKYIVDISNIWYPVFESGKNKKDQLKMWVEKYANLLETFAGKHPYECFLLQDVWSKEK